MEPNLPLIESLRPGSFAASNGKTYTFSREQLAEMCAGYDPATFEAPIVVGHPKIADPAYGWVKGISLSDAGIVLADTRDVHAEFAQAVKAKHYKKVSASVFLPDAPGNPTPGKLYLRHIGFLGAAAPGVIGLKSVDFAAAGIGIAEFSWEDRILPRFMQRIREFLIARFDLDTADQVVSQVDIDDLRDGIARDEAEDRAESTVTGGLPSPSFSTPDNHTAEVTVTEQELLAQKADLDRREASLKAKEAQAAAAHRRGEYAEFAAQLVGAGKLLPGEKDSAIEILMQLDTINQVAEFAAADDHPDHGKTGVALAKSLLSGLPKRVEFGRVGDKGARTLQAGSTADFAAPQGEYLDQDRLELHRLATDYQRQHPGTEYVDAVRAVSR